MLIMEELSPCDLAALRLVCKYLRRIEGDNYLWKQRTRRMFGSSAVDTLQSQVRGISWKQVFALNEIAATAGGTVRRVAYSAVVAEAELLLENAPSSPTAAATGTATDRRLCPRWSHYGGVSGSSTLSPECGDCGGEMSLIFQLALDEAPVPFLTRIRLDPRDDPSCDPSGLLQLFLCARGCDSRTPFSPASHVRLAPKRGGGCDLSPPVYMSTSTTASVAAGFGAHTPHPAGMGVSVADQNGEDGTTTTTTYPELHILDWEPYPEDLGEYWHAGGVFSSQVPYYDFFTPAIPLASCEKKLVFPHLPIPSRSAILRKRHPMEHAGASGNLPADAAEAVQEADAEDAAGFEAGELLIKAVSPCDKLGGFPLSHPGSQLPDCPSCGSAMDGMVAQIASAHHVPIMLGDCGVGQILQCPRHPRIMTFVWDSVW